MFATKTTKMYLINYIEIVFPPINCWTFGFLLRLAALGSFFFSDAVALIKCAADRLSTPCKSIETFNGSSSCTLLTVLISITIRFPASSEKCSNPIQNVNSIYITYYRGNVWQSRPRKPHLGDKDGMSVSCKNGFTTVTMMLYFRFHCLSLFLSSECSSASYLNTQFLCILFLHGWFFFGRDFFRHIPFPIFVHGFHWFLFYDQKYAKKPATWREKKNCRKIVFSPSC